MNLRNLRITYSGVASTAALVIALSAGGAYAADLIGTKRLAKGAVTTPKIHKGAVTTAKIKKGAVGQAKIKNGSVGATKLDAATNANIVPPWGTIPSGKTVTGFFKGERMSGAVVGSVGTYLVLPADAPEKILAGKVAFGTSAGGTTIDPRCTGTVYAPTAPAGVFCVYASTYGLKNGTAYASTFGGNQRAIGLSFDESSPNIPTAYSGGWAYTAP